MFYNMYLVLSEECCRVHTALGEGQNSEMCQYKEHLPTHVFQEGQFLSHHSTVGPGAPQADLGFFWGVAVIFFYFFLGMNNK